MATLEVKGEVSVGTDLITINRIKLLVANPSKDKGKGSLGVNYMEGKKLCFIPNALVAALKDATVSEVQYKPSGSIDATSGIELCDRVGMETTEVDEWNIKTIELTSKLNYLTVSAKLKEFGA